MNSITETEENTKTSDQLKQEFDEALAKVDQDLTLLKKEVTPGHIIDDFVFGKRHPNMSDTVARFRKNPIGTTLWSLGSLLLKEDQKRSSGEAHLKNLAQKSNSLAHEAGEKAKHVAEDVAESAKEKLYNVKSFVSDKIDSLKSHSQGSGESDYFASSYEQIAQGASQFSEQAKAAWKKFNSSEYKPIALAAVGLGIGVILGVTLTRRSTSVVSASAGAKGPGVKPYNSDISRTSGSRLVDPVTENVQQVMHH